MTRTGLFLRYILLINLFTFIARGIDKYKAQTKRRRISEKNLLRYAGLGGRIGAVLGMEIFRHKTIKDRFLTRFRLIATIRIIIAILLLFTI